MSKPAKNPYYQGPVSDHFDGTRFFMPDQQVVPGFGAILKWQLNGQKQKWPKTVDNKKHPAPPPRHNAGDFSVTMIGHATILIQVCGLNILTDPFFSDRTSPVSFAGPKRVRKPGIAIKDLPPIDYVLLSHNHYDHLDIEALKQLHKQFEPVIITPLGNAAIVNKTGCKHEIAEADWQDTFPLNSEVKVTLTPARHWSKRTLNDRNMALWCGFLLQTPFGPIYFAGDTGYGNGSHFRDILDRYGPVRLSFLPIGAYEPRWFMKAQHMNPDDAVKAHLDLQSQQSIAFHHGTIQLTDEAMDAPQKDLAIGLKDNAVDPARFLVLDCGQSKKFT
jgi:L-ascorbate metabolism protein UlaG (beta-lactamase superfamily)